MNRVVKKLRKMKRDEISRYFCKNHANIMLPLNTIGWGRIWSQFIGVLRFDITSWNVRSVQWKTIKKKTLACSPQLIDVVPHGGVTQLLSFKPSLDNPH